MLKKVSIGLLTTLFFLITSCGETPVELITGQIYDEGAGTWYEEFDAGLGDKSVEGNVDLNQLNSKVDEEGLPIAVLSMRVEYIYQDENNDEQIDVILDPDSAIDGSNVAINIDSGRYALKGLPTVDESKEGTVVITINDHHWAGPTHEAYFITGRYPASSWNASTTAYQMPSAEYRLADSSISLTVNLKYYIDEEWLNQGKPEDHTKIIVNYTEKTYDQLSILGTISVEDYVSGLGLSNVNANDTLSYNAGMQFDISDLQSQQVTLTGIHGGHYDQVVAQIIFDDISYGNYTDFSDGYTLYTGESDSITVDIYIPSLD